MIQATDLSVYQTVDYARMKASGIQIALIRVGQGTNITDTKYLTHRDGCIANGVEWGAYLFGDYRYPAGAQGVKLWTLQGSIHGRAHDVMDMEFLPAWGRPSYYAMYQWGCAFISGYESVSGGHKLAVYMNLEMLIGLRPFLRAGDAFLRHELWLASWSKTPPANVAPWARWTYWQNAGDVPVAWSKGAADLDFYSGTMAELTGEVTPVPPEPAFIPWQGRVKAFVLNIRCGPASTWPTNGYLVMGTVVTVLEERDGWGRIDRGWVSLQWLTKQPPYITNLPYVGR